MNENQIAILILIFFTGSILGALIFWLYQYFALGGFKRLSLDILNRAELDAADIKRAADLAVNQRQIEQQRELEKLRLHDRKKIQREEERIKQREDKLESRMNLVEKTTVRYRKTRSNNG